MRTQHENAREPHPALLPPGKFMRITTAEARIEPDRLQHFVNASPPFDAISHTMDAQRLVERVSDAPPRIERRAGILMHILALVWGVPRLLNWPPRHYPPVQPD